MKRLALCLFAALTLSACSAKMIPGTNIEDTSEARELIDVMRAYTAALESRDIEKILAMASKDFFETCGTVEGSDDFDRSGLEAHLKTWFDHFKAIRSRIEVRKISYDKDAEGKAVRARVAYFYDISFQVPEGNGSDKLIWQTESDTKEMGFQREGDDNLWKILYGI